MTSVVVLVGNPKPESRTYKLAVRAAELITQPATPDISVIDLADHTDELFVWPSERLAALAEQVATCDLLVVATPTYKGTYTGLLKTFLDRYPHRGLDGVVAIPLMTGADLRHQLAPDVSLRPLLAELGASLPTDAVYFVMSDMDRADAVLGEWADRNRQRLFGQVGAR